MGFRNTFKCLLFIALLTIISGCSTPKKGREHWVALVSKNGMPGVSSTTIALLDGGKIESTWIHGRWDRREVMVVNIDPEQWRKLLEMWKSAVGELSQLKPDPMHADGYWLSLAIKQNGVNQEVEARFSRPPWRSDQELDAFDEQLRRLKVNLKNPRAPQCRDLVLELNKLFPEKFQLK